MTQEEKQLLLKDLCARLPYGVKVCYVTLPDSMPKAWDLIGMPAPHLADIIVEGKYRFAACDVEENIRPYLRPMSSMTEEECITLSKLIPYETDAWKYIKTPIPLYIANIEQFDFFHRHHLDWRGLIQKGLALEAPEGMYSVKKHGCDNAIC